MDLGQSKRYGDNTNDSDDKEGSDNSKAAEPEAEQKHINKEKLNIDSLREEDKDSDSFHMEMNDKTLHFTRLKAAWNNYTEISGNNFGFPMAFMIGTIIYLEIMIHLLNYRSIDLKIIYPILFAVPYGILMGFAAGLFSPAVNRVIFKLITGLACLLFTVQLIYFHIFKVYFSFQTIGMAGDAISEFGADALPAIKANIGGMILLFIPLFVLILLLDKQMDYARRCLKLQVLLIVAAAVFHSAALLSLLPSGTEDYSPYDLYHKSKVPDLCAKELGITVMTQLDIGKLLYGENELELSETKQPQLASAAKAPTKIPSKPVIKDKPAKGKKPAITSAPTPAPVDTSPNILNIDFNALAAKEKNDTFRTLDNYFASVTPTNKNEYTGMFKGYNLILLTAEGFSPYAVHKDKTPTLYKLIHEGFVFNNFYTSLWQTSTSDGEYVALTGLIPTGSRNMYHGRKNYWPFALGNQFDRMGVASKAYHDHTYTYYQRNVTHPNLGYIFKAKGNGLVLEHPDIWPESDVEMIESTFDEYAKEKQFHVYYLTVSGHMNYSFNGNRMAYKNQAEVVDLPYSEEIRAYIACQMELDKALELLIKKLEAAGIADRTVIALSADHYPYAWSQSTLNEAAGHEVEQNFERFRNHFILWSEGMKENVVIDEPCSSLDILPTLSNLFGIEYDSRLLMGQDVLSDAPPLVVLSNRSFITDKVMYNAENGKVTRLTDEELPENYISDLNSIVKNKFTVSKSILEKDYYRHLFLKLN